MDNMAYLPPLSDNAFCDLDEWHIYNKETNCVIRSWIMNIHAKMDIPACIILIYTTLILCVQYMS